MLIEEFHFDPDLPDRLNRSPIFYTASSGWLDSTKYLVENAKANINYRNSGGETPIMKAAI